MTDDDEQRWLAGKAKDVAIAAVDRRDAREAIVEIIDRLGFPGFYLLCILLCELVAKLGGLRRRDGDSDDSMAYGFQVHRVDLNTGAADQINPDGIEGFEHVTQATRFLVYWLNGDDDASEALAVAAYEGATADDRLHLPVGLAACLATYGRARLAQVAAEEVDRMATEN